MAEELFRPGSRVKSQARRLATPQVVPSAWGSIGAFVRGPTGLWLLTANHVIAGNGALTNFPRATDGVRAGNPPTVVSKEVFWIPVTPGSSADNCADAAICRIMPAFDPEPPLYPPEWSMQTGKPARPAVGDTVQVLARDGIIRTGTVIHASRTISLALDLNGTIDNATFQDQIVIQGNAGKFINPGDSGSLVVLRNSAQTFPVGIAFGVAKEPGLTHLTAVSPLETILKGLSTVTGGATEILV